jgi:hypothetical protein
MRYLTFYGAVWEMFEGSHLPPSPALQYGSPAHVNAARHVLDAVARVCGEYGFGYGDWMMYPYDEYLGPAFVRSGQITRAANPHVRIFSDKSDDLAEMQAAAPYVDVWCPHTAHLDSDQDGKRRAFMRQTGKPIWNYTCSGSRQVPSLSHRWQGWFTFHHQLDGLGTWIYYESILGHGGLVADPADVGLKDGENGWWVIWSPRLLAWTDGIEDHLYLTMLERYCAEHPRSKSARKVRKLLDAAVTDVLGNPGDPQTYLRWTKKLGEAIERLGIKKFMP